MAKATTKKAAAKKPKFGSPAWREKYSPAKLKPSNVKKRKSK